MKKDKKYFWYVNTGQWHKQIKVKTKDMETARIAAWIKLRKMPYEEFKQYVSFNTSGMPMFPSALEVSRG